MEKSTQKAINDSRMIWELFEEGLANRKKMKPEDRKKIDMLKFSKGKKLWLEIEVVDPEVSSELFTWLHRKDSNGEPLHVFGAKLQSIGFVPIVESNELIERIRNVIEQFNREKNGTDIPA